MYVSSRTEWHVYGFYIDFNKIYHGNSVFGTSKEFHVSFCRTLCSLHISVCATIQLRMPVLLDTDNATMYYDVNTLTKINWRESVTCQNLGNQIHIQNIYLKINLCSLT